MKKPQAPQESPRLFLVLVGIENDTLNERYEPGPTAVDLSRWPADVLAVWVEQGVIRPATQTEEEAIDL